MIASRYSLDREIGRGGTGVVWLGRDEMLGRQVALKRIGLLPGADRTDLARAEREARLSAQLNHPNVVGVFDVVVDPDTEARWLVMEFVDGVTLGQLVRERGPLSPDDAAPLLRQVADALVAAHAAGIAHRDVKPSNVLVDRNGQVKLTDFGIARIASDATLTQTGMVTGSPAYLAPEVATGARGDEASDVWSLGATAFHLLAGRPPYEIGDHVLGALYRIVNEEPPRLADAGWMAPLLEATMVRDPGQRWSMSQVRDFLTDPDRAVPPVATSPSTAPSTSPSTAPSTSPPTQEADGTRALGTVVPPPADGPPSARRSATEPAPEASRRRRTTTVLLVSGALVVVVALALYAGLSGWWSDQGGTASPPAPTDSPSAKQSATPTAQGIESFIRDYVSTVADDPAAAWKMLSPKFQQESGGFDTYRRFWDSATNGEVLSISPDPKNLTVSYQVHFDNFHNGPGPTVLDLSFENGHYLIDGERTQGFEPAG